MYAIFEDGSRQYRVSKGDRVRIDHRDVEVGDRVELGRVLLCADGDSVEIGQPLVDGARVLAQVVGQPSVKTYIQKFRRRKNYRRLTGHRQPFVEVEVTHILLKDQETPPEEERKPAPAPAPAVAETSEGQQTEQPPADAPTEGQQQPEGESSQE